MTDLSTLAEAIFEAARRHGWVIEDLNDNPHGLRVRGENWKASHDDYPPVYAWHREGLAEPLAHWILLKWQAQNSEVTP